MMLLIWSKVSERHKFVSSQISGLPLSSSHLLWNAALLYLPCRGINRLSKSPLSPLSPLITSLIGWRIFIHFCLLLLLVSVCVWAWCTLYSISLAVRASQEQYPVTLFTSCKMKSLVARWLYESYSSDKQQRGNPQKTGPNARAANAFILTCCVTVFKDVSTLWLMSSCVTCSLAEL